MGISNFLLNLISWFLLPHIISTLCWRFRISTHKQKRIGKIPWAQASFPSDVGHLWPPTPLFWLSKNENLFLSLYSPPYIYSNFTFFVLTFQSLCNSPISRKCQREKLAVFWMNLALWQRNSWPDLNVKVLVLLSEEA